MEIHFPQRNVISIRYSSDDESHVAQIRALTAELALNRIGCYEEELELHYFGLETQSDMSVVSSGSTSEMSLYGSVPGTSLVPPPPVNPISSWRGDLLPATREALSAAGRWALDGLASVFRSLFEH
jgi:hypothetical protein